MEYSSIATAQITKLLDLPTIVGHRGACGSAPENTLASIRRAAALGAEWVELDLTISADGTPITFHDLTLDRCTNGTGAVRQKTWPELQVLDAGSWFNMTYRGEKIPTLKEVVAEIRRLDLGFNLEIKPAPNLEAITAHNIIDELEMLWLPEHRHKLLISSFSETALSIAQARLPWAARGYLSISPPENWCEKLCYLACETLNCNHRFVTHDLCLQARTAGIKVMAYMVNDTHEAQRLINCGIDSIFSDYPEEMLALLAPSTV